MVELEYSSKHRGMAMLSLSSLERSGEWVRTQLRAIKYENGKIGPDCEESKILCQRVFVSFSNSIIIQCSEPRECHVSHKMHVFMIFEVTGRDKVTLVSDFSGLLCSQNSVGSGWCVLEANVYRASKGRRH